MTIKKLLKMGCVAACVLPLTFSLYACGGTTSTTKYYTVTFDSNGGSEVASQQVEEGNTATKPTDPTYDGYTFTAWYTNSNLTTEYAFDSAVTSDFTLYAGWNEVISQVTLTLDYNYDGVSSTTISVESGSVATIDEPTRDGYTFMGWYYDQDCTNAFDVTTTLTADTTLYASWLDSSITIATFYYNDGTSNVYLRQQYSTWVDVPTSPTLSGYVFEGWYEDADCTTAYDFVSRKSGNQTIYASWKTIYTIEAEYTNLDEKFGYGYSGQSSGTGIIEADDSKSGSASNGYYVSWLYYKGATLEFEFDAAEAADDVTIALRISCAFDALELTGDMVYIDVNGEAQYNVECSIAVNSTLGDKDYAITDFATYTIAVGASIQAGHNVVTLVINNNVTGSGGTMKAAAPVVDCLYLYTKADITVTQYLTNIA